MKRNDPPTSTLTRLWATIVAQIYQAQPAVGDSGRPVNSKKKNRFVVSLYLRFNPLSPHDALKHHST